MKKVSAELLPVASLGSQGVDYLNWVYRDGFDASVLLAPRTVMARALADGEPILMVPVTPVLRFGSLATKPGTSVLQVAQGLQQIGALVDQIAKETGFAECEMLTCVEAEKDLCVKRGWYVVLQGSDTWLLRHKVSAMEPIR